jgi:hypothetical protein
MMMHTNGQRKESKLFEKESLIIFIITFCAEISVDLHPYPCHSYAGP